MIVENENDVTAFESVDENKEEDFSDGENFANCELEIQAPEGSLMDENDDTLNLNTPGVFTGLDALEYEQMICKRILEFCLCEYFYRSIF